VAKRKQHLYVAEGRGAYLPNRSIEVCVLRNSNGEAVGIHCLFTNSQDGKTTKTPLNLSREAAQALVPMLGWALVEADAKDNEKEAKP